MSNEPPQTPADPRPNNEPYYIDTHCPDCNTELVLNDEHRPSEDADGLVHPDVWDDTHGDTIWHDEWVCPNCENGIHFDAPNESLREKVLKGIEDAVEGRFASSEEVREALSSTTDTDDNTE